MIVPDVSITLTLHMYDESVRMICAVIGFAVATWGTVKIVGIIGKSNERKE